MKIHQIASLGPYTIGYIDGIAGQWIYGPDFRIDEDFFPVEPGQKFYTEGVIFHAEKYKNGGVLWHGPDHEIIWPRDEEQR